jgi:hypothetical protein
VRCEPHVLPTHLPTLSHSPRLVNSAEVLFGPLQDCTGSYLGGIMLNFQGNITMYCTAKKIPFMHSISGNWAASVPISNIHESVSNLYIPRIGPHIFMQQNRQIDHGNICINPSQTHECAEIGTVAAQGIFVSNFRYWFFAVCPLYIVQSRPTQARCNAVIP